MQSLCWFFLAILFKSNRIKIIILGTSAVYVHIYPVHCHSHDNWNKWFIFYFFDDFNFWMSFILFQVSSISFSKSNFDMTQKMVWIFCLHSRINWVFSVIRVYWPFWRFIFFFISPFPILWCAIQFTWNNRLSMHTSLQLPSLQIRIKFLITKFHWSSNMNRLKLVCFLPLNFKIV